MEMIAKIPNRQCWRYDVENMEMIRVYERERGRKKEREREIKSDRTRRATLFFNRREALCERVQTRNNRHSLSRQL